MDLLSRMSRVGKPADPPVPDSIAIHNGLVTTLRALVFPTILYDKDTCLQVLQDAVESPHVAVTQLRERFGECTGRMLGTRRNQWIWTARLRFNRLVSSDQALTELAITPIALAHSDDSNTAYDSPWGAFLTNVNHEWRPEQDAGPGSSFTLTFEVRHF